jgi:hypothetical protein
MVRVGQHFRGEANGSFRPKASVASPALVTHLWLMSRRDDPITIVGLGMLLMPLLTMWHEIGGHAAFCALQGGHVRTIGAFYVDCDGLAGAPRVLMSCAGVLVNAILSVVAYMAWRHMRSDPGRLVLWLIWVPKHSSPLGTSVFPV